MFRPGIIPIFSAFAQVVFSQTTLSVTSNTTASAEVNAIQTHTVTVGKTNNLFDPDTIQAAVRDVIEFQFFPPNHSVVRAEYQDPCIPYELTGRDKVGFSSGFFPVDTILNDPPVWNLTINDTNPIFFYCAAPNSCINFGMVGVINPNSSVSLATQKKDASSAPYMLAPGQSFPSGETLPPGSSISSTSAAAQSTITDAAGPSTTAAISHGNRLSSGAIAGIVIGGVVVALILGTLLFFCGRHRTMIQYLQRDNRASDLHPSKTDGRTPIADVSSPQFPSIMYGPAEPRIGDCNSHKTPPYDIDNPQMEAVELSAPPPQNPRPYSDSTVWDDSRRNTASLPPKNLVESSGPERTFELGNLQPDHQL